MESGDLTGAVLDGRYRVIEPVAEGAMGVVYRAERVKLGRIVAIKVLHDVLPNELSGRKRFEIEAMAMAKLEHPHCASVLDVGVHNNKPFVVMDFVSGLNLKELITQGPVPLGRASEIVRQTLSGLAHAHEHGIIHRDIKPANIVLSQKTGLGDHVKILDFGLARLHDTSQNLTLGIVVGTPAYMAPEQIRGQAIDTRADVYACGVLLFELLTGKKPYHSPKDDPIEVCKMHLSNPIPRLAEMLPGVEFGELEGIVRKALAKSADDRYASAQEFAAAIEAVMSRRPSLQTVPPRPPSGPAPMSAVGNASAVEVASADVMAIVTAEGGLPEPRPASELPTRQLPRAATPVAGSPRVKTPAVGTPVVGAGVPRWGDEPADGGVPAPAATPAAGTPKPTATPAAGTPKVEPEPGLFARAKTATPAVGSARVTTPRAVSSPGSGVPAKVDDHVSAPGTFLGLAVAPRPSSQSAPLPRPDSRPEDASQPSGISPVPSRIRRGTLLIVGFAVVVVILVIAIAMSRSHGPAAQTHDGGAKAGSEIEMDPALEVVDRANAMLSHGERDAAIEVLLKARRDYPDSAALPYTLGRVYFAKFYWTDGLKNFRDAIRIDPSYRTDPELIKTVLRGFITTPSYNDDLASFLRTEIGAAAVPYLEETAHDHPNANVRTRATNELRRYR